MPGLGGGPPAASTSRPGGRGPPGRGAWACGRRLSQGSTLGATHVSPRALSWTPRGGLWPRHSREALSPHRGWGGGHPVAHRASLVGSGDLGPTESVQELTGAEPRTLSAERAVSGGVDAANPSGSGLTAGDTWDEATLKFPRKGMCVGLVPILALPVASPVVSVVT